MRNRLNTFQVVTGILVVLYLVWEWNIQEYLSVNGLSNTTSTRVDLFVIAPVLIIFIVISLRQYFRKR